MRKIAIMLLVATTLVTLNSCQKKGTETPTTGTSKQMPVLHKISDEDLTARGIHDLIVKTYNDTYTDTLPATRTGMITLNQRVGTIAYSLFGMDANGTTAFCMNVQDSTGYFDSYGDIVSSSVYNTSVLNSEPNAILRAGLSQVLNYTDTDYVSYCKLIIGGLDLSSADLATKIRAEGFEGIMEGSHDYSITYRWGGAGYLNNGAVQRYHFIANADSRGYIAGYNAAVNWQQGHIESMKRGAANAAACSLAAEQEWDND